MQVLSLRDNRGISEETLRKLPYFVDWTSIMPGMPLPGLGPWPCRCTITWPG